MNFQRDRRLFKRYKHSSDFHIVFEANYYKASTIDFSLNGLCIFIERISSLPVNYVIDLKIEDMDLEIQARVVWTKKTGENLIAGLEKLSFGGLLNYYPLPDILLDLQRSDETGILELKRGPLMKRIFIRKGIMVFAVSNQEEDRLEEILLRSGKITPDQYYQSLALMKQEKKPQGKVLVELGYLKPDELVRAVGIQAEEIILSLFSWGKGRISFLEGKLPENTLIMKLSAANLIFQGIKKINDPDYFKRLSPPLDTVLSYSNEPMNLFRDITLTETDRHVLSLIDGTLTLKEILSLASPSSGHFQTLKILCGLISIRMIEIRGGASLEDKGIVEIIQEPKTAVDKTFINRVDDLYSRHKSMDYYTVLGVTQNAPIDEIRKAYYHAAREFHPDQYFHIKSEAVRDKLNTLFAYIAEAYRVLSDPDERAQYDRDKTVHIPQEKPDNKEMARMKFRQGRAALKKGSSGEAEECFGQAVYLDSSAAEYHYFLGMTYARQKNYREAEKALNAALKIDAFNDDFLAELGYTYLGLGLKLRAKSVFEKALKLNRSNKRAMEGLQKI